MKIYNVIRVTNPLIIGQMIENLEYTTIHLDNALDQCQDLSNEEPEHLFYVEESDSENIQHAGRIILWFNIHNKLMQVTCKDGDFLVTYQSGDCYKVICPIKAKSVPVVIHIDDCEIIRDNFIEK